MVSNDRQRPLRSRLWFDDPGNPKMTALYLERYLNYGLTRAELQSGRPIIGIAQTGSDLVPCNRHHLELAERVRDGVRDAGGVPLEFGVPAKSASASMRISRSMGAASWFMTDRISRKPPLTARRRISALNARR
jgi:dihydroxyacid dehydratase/phosphogluconate dehydratase